MSELIVPPGGSRRSYLPVREIGAGSFGVVRKCASYLDGNMLPDFVALKTVSWGPGARLDQETALHEKENLESIAPHDGIVRLLDSWVGENELYLVFEYSEHGNLLDYAEMHGIDNDALWSIHKQVLDTLRHIHRQGFLFLDVKPENVLVTGVNPLKVKFIDFGAACPVDQLGSRGILATRVYSAPEVLKLLRIRDPNLRSEIGPSCDYYSWNISLFTVSVASACGYDGPSAAQCVTSFLGGYAKTLQFGFAPARTAREQLFHDFLQKVNVAAPDKRVGQMTTHSWATEPPAAVLVAAATAWSSVVLAAVAGPSHSPAGAPAPPTSNSSSTSLSTAVGLPAEPSASTRAATRKRPAKRAGVEKCLEKEKVGKSSGVGSTAGKRVTAALKKASMTRGASPGQAPGGPAEGVKQRRATRPIVNYKKFL